MSNVENLAHEFATPTDVEPSTPNSAAVDELHRLEDTSAQIVIDRQYIPSSTLHLNNDDQRPGTDYFRKLVNFFEINQGPSLPRSNATVDLLATIFCFALVHFIILG